jgi:hypothetical protein
MPSKNTFEKPSARRWSVLLFSLLLFLKPSPCFSQTNISGVVNTYYKVVEVIPSKACVRLNTIIGLDRLQKTLLVQMKGATVNTTNGSTFGDTTSLNNAGNYEVAIICSISGDSVFMLHNFLNNYTVADKVQLVKFAEYYSANITDTIKATPWNNTNGVGGVIAISVVQTLELHAPVYGDSSGSRGGAYVLSSGTCANPPIASTNYFYNGSFTSPQNGSYKGESVYDFPLAQSGGRGAPANGGGGGNNHNNGGGGGANLASGGIGGGNSSSAGCSTDLHGLAGKPLKNWGDKKIFFGGGGGAGHSNGALTVSNGGGNGGGLVIIIAGTLIGNGYKISANGGKGGDAVSDGASGGGAGGTVIMNVETYSGVLTIEAKGGAGGDANDAGTLQRCYGAGGGGSGGAIYFFASLPSVTTSIAGGNAGLEWGRDGNCNAAILSTGGANGNIISSYSIRQSTDSSSYCISLAPLATGLISFTASPSLNSIVLNWKLSQAGTVKEFVVEKKNGSGRWNDIHSVMADSNSRNYSYTDNSRSSDINLYRLRIIDLNNSYYFSPERRVIVKPTETFNVYPNPLKTKLTIKGNISKASLLQVSDLAGRIIWEKNIQSSGTFLNVQLPPLADGIYFLKINDEIKKIVVEN